MDHVAAVRVEQPSLGQCDEPTLETSEELRIPCVSSSSPEFFHPEPHLPIHSDHGDLVVVCLPCFSSDVFFNYEKATVNPRDT